MQRPIFCTILAINLLPASVSAAEAEWRLTVAASLEARENVLVHAAIELPEGWKGREPVALADANGRQIPAQLVPRGLLWEKPGEDRVRVVWAVVPKIAANESATFRLTAINQTSSPVSRQEFQWKDTADRHADLLFDGRPGLRYVHAKFDPNEPRKNTKPFHHLFDPAGERIVTNSGDGGLYPHHQGLMYGFTRCDHPGGTVNLWASSRGESQTHEETLELLAGPVVGRHRARIHWNGRDGKPFAEEIREVAAFHLPGGTLVEWSSRLKSLGGTVTLMGDAQHAGFQVRAAASVADRKNETYFLRPDGKGAPGTERNKNEDHPWNAMSFMIAIFGSQPSSPSDFGDTRFTILYIDHPENPRPSEFGERTYGRFGAWPKQQKLEEGGEALELRYRVWLQRGEMTVEHAAELAKNFAEPPKTTVAPAR